jgi:hypothetical protein
MVTVMLILHQPTALVRAGISHLVM